MIILITGASHTGKTVLSQKLLEKYKFPYLSVDHLKMGLIRSGNTDLTPEDDDQLTTYLWPIVREMIKTAIENKQKVQSRKDAPLMSEILDGIEETLRFVENVNVIRANHPISTRHPKKR